MREFVNPMHGGAGIFTTELIRTMRSLKVEKSVRTIEEEVQLAKGVSKDSNFKTIWTPRLDLALLG